MKNIHLENDSCVVRILPERGGKICTFLDKANDFQVAAVTDRPYLPVGEDSFFSESDMSGIDDAFVSKRKARNDSIWWKDTPVSGSWRDLEPRHDTC